MKSKIKFSATFTNCYTEHGVPVIGIGDDPESPENYIIISQFIDKNESIDESIGLQGHFINNEISNAIKRIKLSKEHLTINIREDKEKKIGVNTIDISLYITSEMFDELSKYIENIFDKSTSLIELSN